MKQRLAFVILTALILLILSFFLVHAQQTIADETVTLNQDGKDYRNISLDEGTNVTIDISVQSGDPIYFTIWYHTGNDPLYSKLDVTSVQTQWSAPSTDAYDFYVRSGGTSTAQVLIRVGQGGGGFDPLPIVIVIIVLVIVFVSALFILRLRKQSSLPPPPPPPPPEA